MESVNGKDVLSVMSADETHGKDEVGGV